MPVERLHVSASGCLFFELLLDFLLGKNQSVKQIYKAFCDLWFHFPVPCWCIDWNTKGKVNGGKSKVAWDSVNKLVLGVTFIGWKKKTYFVS